jgi:hypothetical protein
MVEIIHEQSLISNYRLADNCYYLIGASRCGASAAKSPLEVVPPRGFFLVVTAFMPLADCANQDAESCCPEG